ncbi:MAG: VCBS repeat-containing protein [Bryobacteraceae bacterium]|jgi:hypothetical protein
MDGWLGRVVVFALLALPAIAQQISFKPAVDYPVPVPTQMVAADFNHDGKVDLVVITTALAKTPKTPLLSSRETVTARSSRP